MKRIWFPLVTLAISIVLFSVGAFFTVPAFAYAKQIVDTPTTQALTGIFIIVITEEPQINVRMGPGSSIYPVVGTLLRGATAPALGRSSGGDWIQIEYPGAPYDKGWVYSPLVQVSPGTLLVVEPPPTPQPPATSTIDPTFAAQFTFVPTGTRLPTFTPPPSLVVQIYTQAPVKSASDSTPLAVIIFALFVLGIFGFLLSIFLRR